ncbi:hypothetical protein C8F04DRAFT_1178320 [Mycena alexandri]|uniref:Uncharacterized protein n=1 Tax=Mycena alexandri TaxID=1745969 RepID=A0AAD6X7X0_9AGAR|nr:hypothetical protein C8F04DRAFT_1178320 [Mycena alexandri]
MSENKHVTRRTAATKSSTGAPSKPQNKPKPRKSDVPPPKVRNRCDDNDYERGDPTPKKRGFAAVESSPEDDMPDPNTLSQLPNKKALVPKARPKGKKNSNPPGIPASSSQAQRRRCSLSASVSAPAPKRIKLDTPVEVLADSGSESSDDDAPLGTRSLVSAKPTRSSPPVRSEASDHGDADEGMPVPEGAIDLAEYELPDYLGLIDQLPPGARFSKPSAWRSSAAAAWCAGFDEHPQQMVDEYSEAYLALHVLRYQRLYLIPLTPLPDDPKHPVYTMASLKPPVQRPYVPAPAPTIPESAFENSHTSAKIEEVYKVHAGVRELHDKAEVKLRAEWTSKYQAELREYKEKQARYRTNVPLVWKDRQRQISEYNTARRNADANLIRLLNSIGEYAHFFVNSVIPSRSAGHRTSATHPASSPVQDRAAGASTAASKSAGLAAPVASSSRSRSSFVDDQIADESSGGASLEQEGNEGRRDDDGDGESEREASEGTVPSTHNKGKGRKLDSPEVVAGCGAKGESGAAANTYDKAQWHRENDPFSGPMPESRCGKAISTHGWTPTKTAPSELSW